MQKKNYFGLHRCVPMIALGFYCMGSSDKIITAFAKKKKKATVIGFLISNQNS